MDSILKLVYSNYYVYSNKEVPLLNGMHNSMTMYIKEQTLQNNCKSDVVFNKIKQETQHGTWAAHLLHCNLLGYASNYPQQTQFIKIEDIIDNNDIYLYPVEICTDLDKLTSIHSLYFNGVTYSYSFKDTIPSGALKLMQEGKLKILLNIIHDPITDVTALVKFEKYMEDVGVNGSNIVCIAGNNFQDYKLSGSKIKITWGLLALQQHAADMISYPRHTTLGYVSDIVRQSDLDNTVVRSKKFLSFNRSMDREHRLMLAYMCIKYNLLSYGIFSFLNISDFVDVVYEKLGFFVNDAEIALKIAALIPYEIDTQLLGEDERKGFNTGNNKKEFYNNSYIHIVTESQFVNGDTKHPFISEKTFRPIANLQPFIYMGNAYSLKTLQDLGFKTFHPFIDETYDLIEDPRHRMLMIELEIKKFNDMSIEKIHGWYYSITDILLYNQQHLSTFKDTNPFDTAFTDIRKFYGN